MYIGEQVSRNTNQIKERKEILLYFSGRKFYSQETHLTHATKIYCRQLAPFLNSLILLLGLISYFRENQDFTKKNYFVFTPTLFERRTQFPGMKERQRFAYAAIVVKKPLFSCVEKNQVSFFALQSKKGKLAHISGSYPVMGVLRCRNGGLHCHIYLIFQD